MHDVRHAFSYFIYMPKKKSNNYVDNDELRNELIKSQDSGQLTQSCLSMFIAMTDRIQSKFTYKNDDDRQDCRSRALEQIITKYEKYDRSFPNAFSWVTQTIKNGLYAGWNELNKSKADFSTSNIFTDSI